MTSRPLSLSTVKRLKRLHRQPSFRKQLGQVIVTGKAVVRDVLASGASPCLTTLVLGPSASMHDVLPSQRPSQPLPDDVFNVSHDRLHLLGSVTGRNSCPDDEVVAVFERPDLPSVRPVLADTTVPVLVLDRVSDPRNIGLCIRTCAGLGRWRVVLAGNCADPFHPHVVQVSRGAVLQTPPCVVPGGLEELQDHTTAFRPQSTYVADMSGTPVGDITATDTAAAAAPVLVMGHETRGPGPLAGSHTVSIPMHGDVESFNVGIAAAILMSALQPSVLSSRLT